MPRKRPRSPNWAPTAWGRAPELLTFHFGGKLRRPTKEGEAVLRALPGGTVRHLPAIRAAMLDYAALTADERGRQSPGVDREELLALVPAAEGLRDADAGDLEAARDALARGILRLSESARESLSAIYQERELLLAEGEASRRQALALLEALAEFRPNGRPLDWASWLFVVELGRVWRQATKRRPFEATDPWGEPKKIFRFVASTKDESESPRSFYEFVVTVWRLTGAAEPKTKRNLLGIVKRYALRERLRDREDFAQARRSKLGKPRKVKPHPWRAQGRK